MREERAPEYAAAARAVVEPQLGDGERIVGALGWALTRSRVRSAGASGAAIGLDVEYARHGIKRPTVPIVVTNRRLFVLATTRPPSMLPHRVLAALPRPQVRVRSVRIRRPPWFGLRGGHALEPEVEGAPLGLQIPFRSDTEELRAIVASFRRHRS